MKVSFLVFFPLHNINLFALLLSEQTNVWWPLQGFKLMSKPYKRCWVPSTWWGFMKTKMIHYLSILFNQLDIILVKSCYILRIFFLRKTRKFYHSASYFSVLVLESVEDGLVPYLFRIRIHIENCKDCHVEGVGEVLVWEILRAM
jgi:hypothetical protein